MIAIVGPFLVLMALGAMQPTIEYDALEYHLEGPKEGFLAGRVAFSPHNVYTNMPFSVEMLHLLGMEVLDDWYRGALAGQWLVTLFAPATAILIALTACRLASPRAGWVAAVVYLTTPWVYHLAAMPFVEGPLCLYHAALIWCLVRFGIPDSGFQIPDNKSQTRDSEPIRNLESGIRNSAVKGLLAGGAMACKYPALVSAVIPFGLLAMIEAARRRSWGVLLAFVAGWAVAVGPWLVKNVVDTGNPVYPLAYSVFGGRFWSAEREAKWSHAHGPRPVSKAALEDGLLDIAGRNDWQSPLFVALAPLALLRAGTRRWALGLWGYAAYLFGTWFLLTHRLDRFLTPILPVLAVLAGLGADWVWSRAWTILLSALLSLGIAVNFVTILTPLAGPTAWTADLDVLRTTVPAQLNPPLARLDAELPPDAKVLLVGQASVFHLRHAIVYNTVFDDEILETIARARPPEQVRAELRRQGITHVYVDWREIARTASRAGTDSPTSSRPSCLPSSFGKVSWKRRERSTRSTSCTASVEPREPNSPRRPGRFRG